MLSCKPAECCPVQGDTAEAAVNSPTKPCSMPGRSCPPPAHPVHCCAPLAPCNAQAHLLRHLVRAQHLAGLGFASGGAALDLRLPPHERLQLRLQLLLRQVAVGGRHSAGREGQGRELSGRVWQGGLAPCRQARIAAPTSSIAVAAPPAAAAGPLDGLRSAAAAGRQRLPPAGWRRAPARAALCWLELPQSLIGCGAAAGAARARRAWVRFLSGSATQVQRLMEDGRTDCDAGQAVQRPWLLPLPPAVAAAAAAAAQHSSAARSLEPSLPCSPSAKLVASMQQRTLLCTGRGVRLSHKRHQL